MRAAVAKNGKFFVETFPDPEPGEGEVVVKVRACGICGSDLHYVKHVHQIIERVRALGGPVEDMERGVRQGVVLGHEFVGEIVDFGAGAARTLEKGDRVCSMPFRMKAGAPVLIGSNPETTGAYAEYMTLTEALLVKVDESLPDEAAALVEPVGIAIHAVNKAELREGDVAVVIGCGPIGLVVTAVLRARGVRCIVASDLSSKRRELAGAMGADAVVDPALESVFTRVATLAPGAPVVVFENTGVSGMLNRVVLESPQNARIVVTGIAPDEESFLPMVAISRELTFRFVIYYTPEEFEQAHALLRDGSIDWRPLITGKVGLNNVAQAFADLADPERHAKILVDPWAVS